MYRNYFSVEGVLVGFLYLVKPFQGSPATGFEVHNRARIVLTEE